jgi:hypothetical protein
MFVYAAVARRRFELTRSTFVLLDAVIQDSGFSPQCSFIVRLRSLIQPAYLAHLLGMVACQEYRYKLSDPVSTFVGGYLGAAGH